MTTLVIMRAKGAVDQLREMASRDPNPFEHVRDLALAQGGILRHRVFHADGDVIVVDEWESAEHVQRWMQNPELQAMIGQAGAGQPEVTVAEEIDVGDKVG